MKTARSHCPIAFALDLFGDRWSLLVMRDLIFKQKRRYQEFLDGEEGIATNVLADRLRSLEAHGLITRRRDPEDARQVRYAPTEKGLDLVPVLLEIVRWSGHHDRETAAPAEFLRRLERDPRALRDEIVRPLRTRCGTGAKASTAARR